MHAVLMNAFLLSITGIAAAKSIRLIRQHLLKTQRGACFERSNSQHGAGSAS